MDDDSDPYDDYDEDEVCDHDDHDVDILTGRATCWRCGAAWWLTSEQLTREIECFAAMIEADDTAPDTAPL